MRRRWLACTLGGVLAAAPVDTRGDVAEVFSSPRRIDPAIEIDYRIHFPTPDHLERFEVPADRVGRERVDDARSRVARAYLREITDALADEAVERLPLLAHLQRRYDELTTFRLGEAGLADATSRVSSGFGRRSVSAALVHDLASPWRRDPETTEVRLRVNGGGLSLSLAPTVEITRGPLRCRVGYRLAGDRLEVALARRLFDRIDLEITGSESMGNAGAQVAVGVRVAF